MPLELPVIYENPRFDAATPTLKPVIDRAIRFGRLSRVNMIATGFFGVPGSAKGNFTVHAVDGGKTLCGWHPRKNMEFQWCAHGIRWEFLECESCKKQARPLLKISR